MTCALWIHCHVFAITSIQQGKVFSFPEKNPFIDADEEDEEDTETEAASVGYRYRQFDLGGGIQMVVRCEVDGVLPNREHEKDSTEIKFASIKALNEFDSRVNQFRLNKSILIKLAHFQQKVDSIWLFILKTYRVNYNV